MMFRAEVMPDAQLAVLRRIGGITRDAGFYLGGGTAVAAHLGHRRSIDFDWFCSTVLDPAVFAAQLRKTDPDVRVQGIDRGTLHVTVGGVAISFLEYPYPLLEPLLDWDAYACRLAAVPDLACMKLSAVASRGSRKDLVDAAALLRSGIGLAELIDWYRAKYGISDVAHVLTSLCYFDDAEGEAMPEMLWSLSWEEAKAALRTAVQGYS